MLIPNDFYQRLRLSIAPFQQEQEGCYCSVCFVTNQETSHVQSKEVHQHYLAP